MKKEEYLQAEEAKILKELETTDAGSARYEDLIKSLERISDIKRKDLEAESKSRNEAVRIDVEDRKSKRETIVKAAGIGAGFTLGGLILWFEDSGNFIRSKVFSWLKFFK